MRYHKIRNIPKEVCTCEQKIAYNVAFLQDNHFGDEFREKAKAATEIQIHEMLQNILQFAIREMENSPSKVLEKYDIDAIVSALRAGLREYLEHPKILASYDEIGKAFPAFYLNREI